MKRLELIFNKRFGRKSVKGMIPDCYAELTSWQFLASVRLSKGWIDDRTFFMQFFGLTDKLIDCLAPFCLYRLSEELPFLKEDHPYHSAFFFPELEGGFFSPEAKLRGVSFQQFMTADTFYSWYMVTDKELYLDRFIAALYLREKESYFPASGEIALDLETNTRAIGRLPFDVRYSVMVNWVLIKSWLSRSYSHLFPAGDTAEHSGKTKAKPADWLSVFDAFVGDNIADIEAYKALPCMDAFRLLNRKIKEAKKK